MLIKSDKMDAKAAMNHVDPENINIIKKIIDDFENASPGNKKLKKRSKHKKISNSDSFIHRYKRSQISPKTTSSLDGHIVKSKPSNSVEEFLQKDNDVYINFFENCDNENADANAFLKLRKSVFKGSGSGKLADGFIDEYKVLRESKIHQERVRNNVREVSGTRNHLPSLLGRM